MASYCTTVQLAIGTVYTVSWHIYVFVIAIQRLRSVGSTLT